MLPIFTALATWPLVRLIYLTAFNSAWFALKTHSRLPSNVSLKPQVAESVFILYFRCFSVITAVVTMAQWTEHATDFLAPSILLLSSPFSFWIDFLAPSSYLLLGPATELGLAFMAATFAFYFYDFLESWFGGNPRYPLYQMFQHHFLTNIIITVCEATKFNRLHVFVNLVFCVSDLFLDMSNVAKTLGWADTSIYVFCAHCVLSGVLIALYAPFVVLRMWGHVSWTVRLGLVVLFAFRAHTVLQWWKAGISRVQKLKMFRAVEN